MSNKDESRSTGIDFIRAKVADDLATDKYGGRVVTRFPPEPNGYLHIGHAKAICLDFGLANENRGACHLRFDDTNPTKEDVRYAEAIQRDVRWLGFDWGDHLYYASDYFERLYDFAVTLIRRGKAYVDSLSDEEIREYRGTVTEPGRDSPYRGRSVDENLDLFAHMRAGDFEDGAHVLRAKIDMSAHNMMMRDPILYRILHAHHYRTGDDWCIYPLYDFAHCLSDSIEGVTHSLCTLEFENNRELYDWILNEVGVPRPPPEQTEFGAMNLDYMIVSKRKLLLLVQDGSVTGWDDPRLPTLAGLRRRGVTPESIRNLCDMVGVARTESQVDIGKLEYAIRDHLNHTVPRVMCVVNPLKVVITNYPDGGSEELDAPLYPRDIGLEGSRRVPFSGELYIERDDFMEDPPKGFHRLSAGVEVRLRYAYFVRCDEVIRDPASGEVVELRCTYDPKTQGGDAPDGRKVKGTIHWVSAPHSLPAALRLYDRLFTVPNPEDAPEGKDFRAHLNPDALVTVTESRIEPSVGNDPPGTRYQFERQGYFISDSEDSSAEQLVFNRTVTLRDTWSKRGEGGAVRERAQATARRGAEPGRDTGREARDRVRAATPELEERRLRYVSALELYEEDADILTGSLTLSDFFEEALVAHGNARGVANWIIHELLRELKGKSLEALPFGGGELGRLVALIDDGTVSGAGAKEVFGVLAAGGGDPAVIVETRGLAQVSDREALAGMVDEVLAANPAKVAEYQDGKHGLIGFFMGQVMRASGGKADPKQVQSLLRERLGP